MFFILQKNGFDLAQNRLFEGTFISLNIENYFKKGHMQYTNCDEHYGFPTVKAGYHANRYRLSLLYFFDRFNFWTDNRGTSDEKAIKGAFLTAVGKDAFSLLRTVVYPKTLRDASIAQIQGALLRHVRPAQF